VEAADTLPGDGHSPCSAFCVYELSTISLESAKGFTTFAMCGRRRLSSEFASSEFATVRDSILVQYFLRFLQEI
jgi:hypothetical protein